MAKPKELKFKPYVGLFFKFVEKVVDKPSNAIIGKKLYGNVIEGKIRYTKENLPKSILVVNEKRNHVKFLGPDNQYYWTPKTNIEPLELPTFDGNPLPILKQFKSFLVYCTDTRMVDFRTDEMVSRAKELLPKIEALIENQKVSILPKG